MSRPACPACNSLTGMGEQLCFKCGYRTEYKNTDGYFQEAKIGNSLLTLRDDLEFRPSRFSVDALKWLYSASIYPELIIKQCIGFCRDINKVFLPAFVNNRLAFYQLRALNENDVKYITYGNMRNYTIMYKDYDNKQVVIVEDHLSAIRLRNNVNVLCLNGTYLSREAISILLNSYQEIIFWLDADAPGQKATTKAINILKYQSDKHQVKSLFTMKKSTQCLIYRVDSSEVSRDPKCYTDYEIKNILTTNIN